MARYVQPGNSINYTNTGAAIKYGQVIPFEGCVAIAAADIPKNTVGALDLTGAFEFPAVGAIEVGQRVCWDTENEVITAPHEAEESEGGEDTLDLNANLIPAGIAITAKAGTAEGVVVVRLCP